MSTQGIAGAVDEQRASAKPRRATGPRESAAVLLRKAQRRRRLVSVLEALPFLAPAVLLVLALRLWPLLESLRLSFTDWDGISKPNFIGLDNFRRLWHDDRFWRGLRVNLKLLIAVPVFVLVPLVIASILQSRIAGWRIFRSVYFFPTLLSPAVVALTFKLLLREDGPLNSILHAVGLHSWARLWFRDPTWSLVWIVLIGTWAGMGVGVVIFLAAMGTVDTDLIDAARLDGAKWLHVQRHVVFPQILPLIELWTVLSLIGVFTNFFGLILLITNGGPDFATTTADLYSYQLAFTKFDSGYASAVTVVLFILAVVVGGSAFVYFRRRRVE